ncbi:MAG: hypothetical protein RXR02_10655, partial [Thermoproteus sp.]
MEITRPRAIVALGGATGLAVSRALGSRPPESVRGAFAGVEPVRAYAPLAVQTRAGSTEGSSRCGEDLRATSVGLPDLPLPLPCLEEDVEVVA